ncbi:MAG: prolyl oligopeptidase family serine peptidase [Bacteroidia bacterium]|nr:prolyl oligopeptidase family serine peptidase [Bacteroidia bacterium]
MKKYFILGMIMVFSSITSFGQTNVLNIPFFETPPVVDGLPDKGLNIFEWQNFSVEKTNEQNKVFTVHYKMVYEHTYLYLLIETDSDTIIWRDRAYQNGDGFHLVIAKPDFGKPTGEFYVLRFSPENKSKQFPAKKGVWYYNIDLSGKPLSSATQFVCKTTNGKSYFELLLPWSEVYPYHPLFTEDIGINLCFVKAIGDNDKNFYYLKFDTLIQSELSKREYILASFEPPKNITHSYSLAMLEQKNIIAGNTLKIKIISFSESTKSSGYYITVRSADNYIYTELYKEIQLSKGCSDNSKEEIPFTVLPEIKYEKDKISLDDIKNNISQGDYNTLHFMLQNLVKEYQKVKKYETAGDIRERYLTYYNYIIELKKDNHLLSNKKGIFRRAFLSKIDSTLQPYSIKIPENFEYNKKYPLFVMLHGSGSDDQAMLYNSLTENNFIEIAPFGRGTSNCFTIDNAQVDVKEAINDVINNYPIDTTKIIIAGFSMGGYGAYRIFYEYPKLFKGIAVFSGHPNLASKYIGKGNPDFLNTKYLKPLKQIPVFIYHSKNDLNCPYDLTKQLVDKLIKVGAKVKFVTTSEGGHGIIDKDNISAYYKWLGNIIENKK